MILTYNTPAITISGMLHVLILSLFNSGHGVPVLLELGVVPLALKPCMVVAVHSITLSEQTPLITLVFIWEFSPIDIFEN